MQNEYMKISIPCTIVCPLVASLTTQVKCRLAGIDRIGDYANQSDKSYKAVTAHLSSTDKSRCWRHVEVLARVAIFTFLMFQYTLLSAICVQRW